MEKRLSDLISVIEIDRKLFNLSYLIPILKNHGASDDDIEYCRYSISYDDNITSFIYFCISIRGYREDLFVLLEKIWNKEVQD